jgi:hypothetical protein
MMRGKLPTGDVVVSNYMLDDPWAILKTRGGLS